MIAISRYWACSVLLVAILASAGSALAAAQELQVFDKWVVYSKKSDAGRICFMSSVPTKLEGDYDRANRGETRVYVTHGPGKSDRNVVSVQAGYRYSKQSEVQFSIDGKKTMLFTLDNFAWAQGADQDQKLIQSMKRGNSLVVTGISSRKNKTVDTYSLAGFTKAKSFLDKTCP